MTGPLTVAHCVSALKSLADKGASIIDYMRKAGALLEDMAPGSGGHKQNVTRRGLYSDILARISQMSP